jgi:hypothetical protein
MRIVFSEEVAPSHPVKSRIASIRVSTVGKVCDDGERTSPNSFQSGQGAG